MIIGIDLGTTHSLAAIWRNGKAELIPNAFGEFLTPSCVSLDEDGSVLVGRAAKERAQTHPERTARAFKRYMGTHKTLQLGNRSFRPEELSALVLKSLKADAQALLGGQVIHEAIISVPAYFSDAQRKATRAAGELTGLKVERLINEPTAAALAYGIHLRDAGTAEDEENKKVEDEEERERERETETRFLVFDLGGGTFDVSILEIFEGVMEVRATAGDNFLGGEDFDACLMALFFERNASLPADLRKDGAFMQRLGAQAERARREIGTASDAVMAVDWQDARYELRLTEALFANACAPLLHRLRAPVERALRDANLRGADLDNIILAGGATRMPIVRRLVTALFGRFPAVHINPDEVVALGAAVQAGLKARDAALDEVVMTDVAPYSLGIEISKSVSGNERIAGYFDPVIERNTPVPVSRLQSYVAGYHAESDVELRIFQGESRLVKDNILLGTLKLKLPQRKTSTGFVGAKQECVFDVRFTYDVNGLLQVEATMDNGEKFAVLIEGNPGILTAEQIQQALKSLESLKIHPRDTLDNRTTLARAERLYQQLRGEPRAGLDGQIFQFDLAIESQEPRRISAVRGELEKAMDALEQSNVLNTTDPDV